MTYKQIKIDITEKQLDKALDGKSFKIAPSQIGSGTSYLSLHPANVRLVEQACMKGKGCILNMSEGELLSSAEDCQGAGFFSKIWKKLRSSYKWAKKNVIDTPEYQKMIKPLVRGVVDQVAATAAAALPGSASVINAGVNELSKQTGAFGAVKGKKRTNIERQSQLIARGLYLS